MWSVSPVTHFQKPERSAAGAHREQGDLVMFYTNVLLVCLVLFIKKQQHICHICRSADEEGSAPEWADFASWGIAVFPTDTWTHFTRSLDVSLWTEDGSSLQLLWHKHFTSCSNHLDWILCSTPKISLIHHTQKNTLAYVSDFCFSMNYSMSYSLSCLDLHIEDESHLQHPLLPSLRAWESSQNDWICGFRENGSSLSIPLY